MLLKYVTRMEQTLWLHHWVWKVNQNRPVVSRTHAWVQIVFLLLGVVHPMMVDAWLTSTCKLILYKFNCIILLVKSPFDLHFFLFFSVEMAVNKDDWQIIAVVKDSLACTFKDIKKGSSYRFRVKAVNIHGASIPSKESDEITIEDDTIGK